MKPIRDEVLYSIALTMVPNVGAIQSKILLEHFSTAENIFRASSRDLENVPGIGTIRARSIRSFRDFSLAEKEIRFMEKFKIRPILYNDEEYPKRLKHCDDPPTMLFYRGNADLNAGKVLSIVGTRQETEYGKQVLAEIMSGLEGSGILVLSGLAYGIDALAHRMALKNGLSTVGVLAHGLDRLYPSQNNALAREMLQRGGLVTDFMSGSKPDKQNFPKRNRIVAGMADALLVIESGITGGSIITVNMAAGYNREVFAVPGRIHDHKSEGCNLLIMDNKARLARSADDILIQMNWVKETNTRKNQPEIFYKATENEEKILAMLNKNGQMHIDQLMQSCTMHLAAFSASLLNLEMEKQIKAFPGRRYGIGDQ